MPVRARTLRVYPNPWTYIDHRGRAAGACPCDPNEHTPDRRWVGATIGEAVLVKPAVSRVVAGLVQQIAAPEHDLRWHYSGPVTIPNTGYYRDKIKKRELLAADEATARAAGLTKFDAPAGLLEEERSRAIEQFNAENGEDAFALLAEQYAEDQAAEAEVLKAIQEQQSETPPEEQPAAEAKRAESGKAER